MKFYLVSRGASEYRLRYIREANAIVSCFLTVGNSTYTRSRQQNRRVLDVCTRTQSIPQLILENRTLEGIRLICGYRGRHLELDGFAVAIEYMSNYQQTKSKKLLRSLLEYNEDDIRSLPWILDRILSIGESLEMTVEIDSARG